MTAAVPDPRFRDQLALWLREHTSTPDGDSWGMWTLDLQRTATNLAAEVEARVQAAANQRAAEALEKAADKWQWSAWADAPRIKGDVVAERLATAQYVTDWLRARAAALRDQP